MTVTVNERELERGTEADLAAAHVTPDGYGRLTIRKHEGRFEIYDLDNDTVVESDTELEPIVEKANEYTPMSFEYEDDSAPDTL